MRRVLILMAVISLGASALATQERSRGRHRGVYRPHGQVAREDGGYVLREDGGRITHESNAIFFILREDGGYVLREDGGRVTREES